MARLRTSRDMLTLDEAVLRMVESAARVYDSTGWFSEQESAYELLSNGMEYLKARDIRVPPNVFAAYARGKQGA